MGRGELPANLLRARAEEQRLLRDLPRGRLVLQPCRLPLQRPLLLCGQLRGTAPFLRVQLQWHRLKFCAPCAAAAVNFCHGRCADWFVYAENEAL